MTDLQKMVEKIEAKRWDANHFIKTETPIADRLTTLSIALGALTAFFSGAPAVGGKAVLDFIGLSEGSESWRVVLAAAALLSLASTFVTTVLKRRQSEARIGKARAAVAKLEGLVLRLEVGATAVAAATGELDRIGQEIPFVQGITALDIGKSELEGRITSPSGGAVVGRKIECSGYVKRQGSVRDLHFWLMVEVKDPQDDTQVWPKERELYLKPEDGTWQRNIFEDGRSPSLDLGLYVASGDSNERIKDWLNEGASLGYRPVQGFPGYCRLDRVDGVGVGHPKRAGVTPPP